MNLELLYINFLSCFLANVIEAQDHENPILTNSSLSSGFSIQGSFNESLSYESTQETQTQRRVGFSISPQICEIQGQLGTCMFVWECLKTDGSHLGMCMDGFMFGSCCLHDERKNIVEETTEIKLSRPTRPLKASLDTKHSSSSSSEEGKKEEDEETDDIHTDIEEKTTTTTTTIIFKTTTITSTTSSTDTEKNELSSLTRPPRPPKPTVHSLDFLLNSVTYGPEESTTLELTPLSSLLSSTSSSSSSSSSSSASLHHLEEEQKTINAGKGGICGVPQINGSCAKGRIVNGTKSCYGQFPWQVSVRRTSFFGFSSTHRCGGALINENWIATAGHCVDDMLIPKIRIRIGEWDFSSTSEPHSHVEKKVIQKIVHPQYNFFTYENDLALLQLDSKVEFKDNIIPICLPGNDDLLIGEIGTVAGWGRLSEGGSLPSILQHVSVPIVSNEKCKAMFLRAGRHELIPDIFMCAGYENGGRDSCQGDSGGPLIVKGKDDRWFLGGIISWGIGCAEANLPGVCTRISKFREWIISRVT